MLKVLVATPRAPPLEVFVSINELTKLVRLREKAHMAKLCYILAFGRGYTDSSIAMALENEMEMKWYMHDCPKFSRHTVRDYICRKAIYTIG